MASATHKPDLPAGRLRQLDVLRGVAILLVLGRHIDVVPTDAPALIQNAVYLWMRAGWIGVDLFFVLSGFLVSGLLFREHSRHGDVKAGRFLARRGLKIYPAFYVFLIATAAYAGTLGSPRFVAEAFFVQNYWPGLWDHTWSLAVEEHFYLLLTLLILVLVGRDRSQTRAGRASLLPATGLTSAADSTSRVDPFRPLVPIFIGVALVALVLRIVTARYGSNWYTYHLCPTHLRIDSLLFGVLLSYYAHYRGPALTSFVERHRDLLLLASVLFLAPAFFLPAMNVLMETVGFTLLYLGFGGVLLLTLFRPVATGDMGGGKRGDACVAPTGAGLRTAARGTVRMHRPLREMGVSVASIVVVVVARIVAWIGVYSYSIYLWHMAVKRWGVPVIVKAVGLSPTGSAAVAVYFISAVLLGAAMARLIEGPGLALRDRWLPSRSGQVPQPLEGNRGGAIDSAPIVGAYI